jgi:HEAT repeat protein
VVGYGRMLVSWIDATVLTEDGEVALRTAPVADLVRAALAVGEDSRSDYTAFLHLRGDGQSFEVARTLCSDADPVRRALGADILGQLGAVRRSADGTTVIVPHDERPFRPPAVTLLLDLAPTEIVDAVQQAIATALGHLADPRAVGLLGRWRTHPQVQVRWSVCLALTPLAADDPDALRYLVELTADPDPMVRDWACFGLYQAGQDTSDVRHALIARVGDDDAVTRAEALRALAALGEPRAVEPLLTALDALDDAPTTGHHREDEEAGEVAGLLDEALSLLADHTQDPRLFVRVDLNSTRDDE